MGKIVKLKNANDVYTYPVTKTEAVYLEDNKTTLKDYLDAMAITKTIGPAQTITFDDGADNIPIKSLILNIEPHQEGTGDPSPENIRPITGYDAVNVVRRGENLLIGTQWSNGGYSSGAGAWRDDNARKTSDYIEIKPNINYLMQIDQLQNEDLAWVNYNYFDANKTWLGDRSTNGQAIINGLRSTEVNISDINAKYIRITARAFSDSSINIADKNIDNAKPLFCVKASYSTYPISFSTAGTVYGGTFDATNGVLTVDRAFLSTTWTKHTSYNHIFYSQNASTLNYLPQQREECIASCLTHQPGLGNLAALDTLTAFRATDRIYVSVQDVTTLEEFEAWAETHNLQVCYKLATPIIYNLTPINITTLFGNNVIWTDTKNILLTTYYANPILYINNMINASKE